MYKRHTYTRDIHLQESGIVWYIRFQRIQLCQDIYIAQYTYERTGEVLKATRVLLSFFWLWRRDLHATLQPSNQTKARNKLWGAGEMGIWPTY